MKIPFKDIPNQSSEPRPFNLSKSQIQTLSEVIDTMLGKEVIEYCAEEQGQVISNVFLRPKPNNKHRLILDLSEFNTKCVEYQHFKMHSLKTALDLVTPGIFMTSIDLSDAYFTVPIYVHHRKYLRFRWQGKLLQFTCLPNGLACAPRLFTRLLNSVFAFFRENKWSCFQYIDDSIVLHPSFNECKLATDKIFEILQKLGFFIHEQKSCLTPKTNIIFLGFKICSQSMKVTPTQEKIQKITRSAQDLLGKQNPTIREVAGFVGLAGAYSIASDYGANHSKNLEIDKIEALRFNRGNYDKRMSISPLGLQDIKWWLNNISVLSKDLTVLRWDMTIITDASLKGWGAISGTLKANGRWNQIERNWHINVLEMLAILFGLQSFVKKTNLNIRLLSDNTTAVSYVNKKGGVHSRTCLQVAQKIWNFAELNQIHLVAAHIPGKHNYIADMYSRHFKENTEWELHPSIFKQIVKTWGKPDIDLFASRLNHKCVKYIAWKPDPSAMLIDAFSINWNFSFVYAFPPFCLVSRVWRKMIEEGVKGVLITPRWPGQPWFAAITQTAKSRLSFPRGQRNLIHPAPELEKDYINKIPLEAFLF